MSFLFYFLLHHPLTWNPTNKAYFVGNEVHFLYIFRNHVLLSQLLILAFFFSISLHYTHKKWILRQLSPESADKIAFLA